MGMGEGRRGRWGGSSRLSAQASFTFWAVGSPTPLQLWTTPPSPTPPTSTTPPPHPPQCITSASLAGTAQARPCPGLPFVASSSGLARCKPPTHRWIKPANYITGDPRREHVGIFSWPSLFLLALHDCSWFFKIIITTTNQGKTGPGLWSMLLKQEQGSTCCSRKNLPSTQLRKWKTSLLTPESGLNRQTALRTGYTGISRIRNANIALTASITAAR